MYLQFFLNVVIKVRRAISFFPLIFKLECTFVWVEKRENIWVKLLFLFLLSICTLVFSPTIDFSVRFQGKPFNITVIQAYTPTSKAEEAEVERFCEDLQDLLELTPPKDVLFIIGDWNAKVRSQETPGVTGKFGLGVQNEAGQRLIGFCQENALVIANTLF